MDRTFAGTPVFRQWPERHVQELVAAAPEIRAAKGKAIVRQGDTFRGLYLVLSGSVEVSAAGASGKRYIHRYARPGTAFGFMSVFDPQPSPYSYVAHEPTRMLFIRTETLIATLMRHPELWLSVARHLAGFQRVALDVVQEQVFEGIRRRLARALLSLARAWAKDPADGRAGLQITQDELAGLLGVSRQSVSKELKRLEREGLVRIGYARIAVPDAAALERVVHEPNA